MAEFLGTEAAISVPMGFATNSMNMPALVSKVGCHYITTQGRLSLHNITELALVSKVGCHYITQGRLSLHNNTELALVSKVGCHYITTQSWPLSAR